MLQESPAAPSRTFDVAIVGLGPVGAALAILLAQRGISVVALDRDLAPHTVPRAAHCGDEAMRVLQACGVADAVLEAGRPIDGFDLVDRNGEVLVRASKKSTVNLGWPTSTLVHQPTIERALRGRMSEFEKVDIRLGHEVTAVRQDADGVTVSGRTRRSEFNVLARYVVGCDGARSMVRDAMEVRLGGGRFEQPWLVVDTILKREVELPTRLQQMADPARPTTYVPFPGMRRRWEFRLLPGESESDVATPQAIGRLLARHIDPINVDIERAVVYTFHDLVAEQWRIGRLLLAGDAAHQMPPFLGEGLGAGFRDVMTLSWLLALVAGGSAPPALLDLYDGERRPRVQAVTRLSARLGRIVSASGATARVRDAVLKAGRALPMIRTRMKDIGSSGPGIKPLLQTAGSRPASPLLPQPLLSDGRHLDAVLGTGFAVLGLGGTALNPSAVLAWGKLGAEYVALDGNARDVIAAWAGTNHGFVVIRPDRIALGVYGLDDVAAAAEDLRRALGQ